MNVITEFNNISISFIDLLYSITSDSDLLYYKKAFNKIIQSEKNKMIEQFIIHCYIYKEKIEKKNKFFFTNLDLSNKLSDDSMLKIIKVKDIFNDFDEDKHNLIFNYLKLLCEFCTAYLENKIK